MCSSCEAIDLSNIIVEADEIYRDLEFLLEGAKTSRFAQTEMSVEQSRLKRKMTSAWRSFERGGIDRDTLELRWAGALGSSYDSAYRLGVSQYPRAEITAVDREFLRRAVASEMGFASRFVRELAAGDMSEKMIESRIDQYVLGAESMKTSGWVRKSSPDTIYEWRLGASSVTCEDCLTLAGANPFTRDTLPALPKSGMTRCRSRCRCELVIVTQQAPSRIARVTNQNPELASGRKKVGDREPTPAERARVDDMRARINYNRRRIETASTEAARNAAIRARRAANDELIQYQQARGIRDVPMLDVSDVISRRQIDPGVAVGLAIRGLDGTTIALADVKTWEATQRDLMAQIDELLRVGP